MEKIMRRALVVILFLYYSSFAQELQNNGFFLVNDKAFENVELTLNSLDANEFFLIIQPKKGQALLNAKLELTFPPNITYYNEKYKLGDKSQSGILPWTKHKSSVRENKLVFNQEIVNEYRPLLVRFYPLPISEGEGKIKVKLQFKDDEEIPHEYTFETGAFKTTDVPDELELVKFELLPRNNKVYELLPIVKTKYELEDGYIYEHECALQNSNSRYYFSFVGNEDSVFNSPLIEVNKGGVHSYTFAQGNLVNSDRELDFSGKKLIVPGKINFKEKPVPVSPPIAYVPPKKWQVEGSIKLVPTPFIKIPKLQRYFWSYNLGVTYLRFDYKLNNTFSLHIASIDMYTNFNKDFALVYSPAIFTKNMIIKGTEIGIKLRLGYSYLGRNQINNQDMEATHNFISMIAVYGNIPVYKNWYIPLYLNPQFWLMHNSGSDTEAGYEGLFIGVGYKF